MVRLAAAATLLALIAGAPFAEAAPSDCTKPAFATAAGLDPAFMCVEMARQDLSYQGHDIVLRSVRDERTNPQIAGQYADEAMNRISEALAVYAGLGRALRFANVTVVAMDPNIPGRMRPGQRQEEFGTASADAQSWGMPNECIIRLYIRELDSYGYADVLEGLRMAMAHEVFHCIQHWNYPKQSSAEMYGDGGASWWVEGSATLMASLVVEDGTVADLSNKFVTKITKKSMTSFLHQEAYETVYFFAWLYGQKPDAIFRLMEGAATTPGEAAQQAALGATYIDFDKFAQDAVDGLVKDAHGEPLADITPTELDEFTDTRSQGMFQEPFQLFTRTVYFRNGMYIAYMEGPHSAAFRRNLGKKAGPASPWSGGILDASTGCEDKGFVLAGMWPRAERTQFVFKAEKMPGTCEKCEPDPVLDQCLVGDWRMNQMSLSDALMEQDTGLKQVIVTGGAGMSIEKNGKHTFGFDKLSIEGIATNDNKVRFRIYIGGGIESAWSAEKGNMKMCYRDSDALIEIVTTGGGFSGTMKFSELPKQSTFRATYTCNEQEMMLTQDVAGEPLTIRFERWHPPGK